MTDLTVGISDPATSSPNRSIRRMFLSRVTACRRTKISSPRSTLRCPKHVRHDANIHASANNLVGIRPTRGLVSRSGVIPNSLTQDEIGPIARTVTDAALLLDVMAGYEPQYQFHFEEATIGSIHDAFAARKLTCAQLTKLYLDRIDAYNLQGPALHAIITVNPKAMDTAAEMDRKYTASASAVGSLHCIPIILKDNFNTFDMPTTGGNVSMKKSLPSADAFTVDKMRRAGALILAKANMQEFARGGMSISSIAAQVNQLGKALDRRIRAQSGEVVFRHRASLEQFGKGHIPASYTQLLSKDALKGSRMNRDKLRLAVAKKMADLNLDAILYPLQ
jgi:Amidase